ncbi:unnamed protein product [Callosobruchus maculatus]|uniref:Uncharacterized protein n=1 Tax=Callosobruchus maculatus TaxID=64391 RepID=A0A653DPA4_CALMS|nr:unnamed protein product [Callosobruchus maculatus]
MPNHDLTFILLPGWAHNNQRDFCSFYRFPKNKTLAEVVKFSKLQKFLIHSERSVQPTSSFSTETRNGAKHLHRYLGR